MASTRDRALDAALALVGEQGIRALTHARVDERAGLPKGSTSNWFRTREALLLGVVTWLSESERADFDNAPRSVIETPAELVAAISELIAVQTGPLAARPRARYSLFLEGARSPELLAPLLAQRAIFVEWTSDLLARVGAPDPAGAVRMLMAAADGLVMHRVTVDPDAEIGPVIERAVRACLV